MTRTPSEARLAARLTQLASYAPAAPRDQGSAVRVASVTPRRSRRSTPAWAMATGAAVVLAVASYAALNLSGDSDLTPSSRPIPPADRSVTGEPSGPAINTLAIMADNFFFGAGDPPVQLARFTAPAGINDIVFVSVHGTHTLRFLEPQLSAVRLEAPGGPSSAKVDLVAGRTYTIYCEIPGHRAAGMEARIIVGLQPGATDGVSTTTRANPEPGAESTQAKKLAGA